MAKVISVRCTRYIYYFQRQQLQLRQKRKAQEKQKRAQHTAQWQFRWRWRWRSENEKSVSFIFWCVHHYCAFSFSYFVAVIVVIVIIYYYFIRWISCARGQRVSSKPSAKPASRAQHMDAYLMYTLNEIDYTFSCSLGSIFNSSIVLFLVCVRVCFCMRSNLDFSHSQARFKPNRN